MHLDHRFRKNPATAINPVAAIIAAPLNDGVEHGNDIMPLGTDLGHDAVDNEGPVAADNFQYRARHLAAIDPARRTHANEDVIAGPAHAEFPEVECQRSEVLYGHALQVF